MRMLFPLSQHYRQEKHISELISVELPEKVVMQLPEKILGANFCEDTKKDILEWRCVTQAPLCTFSVVWCSVWERNSNHKEDDRLTDGRDRGRQAECHSLCGFFRQKVAVWRLFYFPFLVWWSMDLKLHAFPQCHGGDIMGVARCCRA